MVEDKPLVVAWGLGVNSTAMLIGMRQRNIVPDLILAADTKGEKPETYAYIEQFQKWLKSVDFPEAIIVVKTGIDSTLEEQSLRTERLPSRGYGFSSCADKWKRRPQDRYCNHWPPAKAAWKQGLKVIKAIGYDATETRRARIRDDEKYNYWYPLIEWDWARDECVDVIQKEGLEVPPKSACFYCPSSKKNEVIWLKENHPDLFERALKIERIAQPHHDTVMGLGRNWSWENLIKDYDAGNIDKNGKKIKSCSLPVYTDPDDAPCGCFDGD